jgi:hypothetical protein
MKGQIQLMEHETGLWRRRKRRRRERRQNKGKENDNYDKDLHFLELL